MCTIIRNTDDENKSFTLMEERGKLDEMQTELRSTVFALKKATKRRALEDVSRTSRDYELTEQKTDFEQKNDFITENGRYFIGMGHSDTIPKFLRSIGHIPSSIISHSDLLNTIRDIWDSFSKKRKVG
jgi:hypothetical protein